MQRTCFKGIQILERVAIQLDIADMSAVGERMIGRFQTDLLKGVDLVIHRDMEGVGIVIPISYAGDNTVLLLVDAYEPARKAFCRVFLDSSSMRLRI